MEFKGFWVTQTPIFGKLVKFSDGPNITSFGQSYKHAQKFSWLFYFLSCSKIKLWEGGTLLIYFTPCSTLSPNNNNWQIQYCSVWLEESAILTSGASDLLINASCCWSLFFTLVSNILSPCAKHVWLSCQPQTNSLSYVLQILIICAVTDGVIWIVWNLSSALI